MLLIWNLDNVGCGLLFTSVHPNIYYRTPISPGTQILMDWAQGCSSTLFFLSLGIRSQTVVWILKKGHTLPQNSPIMRYNYAHSDNVMTWCRGR